MIDPGDADRTNYASKHKHRHANCDRGGPERGDEVGCGKKVKDKGDDGNGNGNGKGSN